MYKETSKQSRNERRAPEDYQIRVDFVGKRKQDWTNEGGKSSFLVMRWMCHGKIVQGIKLMRGPKFLPKLSFSLDSACCHSSPPAWTSPHPPRWWTPGSNQTGNCMKLTTIKSCKYEEHNMGREAITGSHYAGTLYVSMRICAVHFMRLY